MLPKAICFEQSIGRDDKLSHAGSNGDLGWFAGGDHLLIFGFEVGLKRAAISAGIQAATGPQIRMSRPSRLITAVNWRPCGMNHWTR